MISKESLKSLLDLAKIPAEDQENILNSDDELNVELPTLEIFTPDELEQREKNITSKTYAEAKIAGQEMLIKEIKRDYGIDIEGKDPKAVLDAYTKKVLDDAKIEPSQKLEEKERILKELQNTIEETENNYKTQLEELTRQYQSEKINNNIASVMPDLTALKKEQAIKLFTSDYEVATSDKGFEVKKNGETLVDRLGNPRQLKDVVSEYVDANGWGRKIEGAGGGDQGGEPSKTTSIKSADDFHSYLKENNIPVASQEATKVLKEVKEANPDFTLA